MTSLRQIEANRRNSEKSTGPRTEEGKRQSRRNALRHGLCAETVIEILENVDDYKAFEAAVIADYDAQTAVERELVLRLASLLWRMRRATSIETDLVRIQAEILRDRRHPPEAVDDETDQPENVFYRVLKAAIPPRSRATSNGDPQHCDDLHHSGNTRDPLSAFQADEADPSRDLSHAFHRLINLDSGVFERLGRYETVLWRQTVQTLFALRLVRRRFPRIRDEWDHM
jgi:hypothetical protein